MLFFRASSPVCIPTNHGNIHLYQIIPLHTQHIASHIPVRPKQKNIAAYSIKMDQPPDCVSRQGILDEMKYYPYKRLHWIYFLFLLQEIMVRTVCAHSVVYFYNCSSNVLSNENVKYPGTAQDTDGYCLKGSDTLYNTAEQKGKEIMIEISIACMHFVLFYSQCIDNDGKIF